MTDLRKAAEMALEALEKDPAPLNAINNAKCFLYSALEQPECNPHPDAPHGFNRDASHSLGRYVCDCEGWEPEQKPVAWWNPRYGKGEYAFAEEQSPPDDSNDPSDFGWNIPLYTAPPKREWVGLTSEEITKLKHLMDHKSQWSYIEFADAIEAKLKGKNRG